MTDEYPTREDVARAHRVLQAEAIRVLGDPRRSVTISTYDPLITRIAVPQSNPPPPAFFWLGADAPNAH